MPDEAPADLRSPGESVALDWAAVRSVPCRARALRLDADPPPRQFAGGLANLNYLIHLDGKPAVLRRPPMGELPAGSLRHGARASHPVAPARCAAVRAAQRAAVRRSRGDRPAVPDPGIPAGPGDPRAHAAGTRAPAGDRRAAVAGAAGNDRGDPRGGYRRRSGWTIWAGRTGSWRARSPAGASAAGRRRRTAPTRCTRTSVPGWSSTSCRMARRGCCTTTSS